MRKLIGEGMLGGAAGIAIIALLGFLYFWFFKLLPFAWHIWSNPRSDMDFWMPIVTMGITAVAVLGVAGGILVGDEADDNEEAH